ncbi:glycoside hydrolase family 88 protein [Jaapia argillacea MUCL 33604]|uniref:Glycoside hydrolase family 88 protein n=1 Tax=Jaapia argillacea MUCL 33604 TaxID=933084 RepID=A0A067QAM4_9AGAM|nr:glycoside hydrolase family 88 protein [Jaapia argillacea MUCL 33604]
MPSLLPLISILPVLASAAALTPPSQLFSPLISQKILATASNTSQTLYPQYTDTLLGQWQYFVPDTWTSGFLPSLMYAMNTRATLCPNGTDGAAAVGGGTWVELGRSWSAAEVPLETVNTVGHDVGFLSFPFVDELALNPQNQTAIAAVNAFANDLAARYNPSVGCTRSWDTADPTLFTVIMDNMMNLDILLQSEALTGNTTLRDIATSHADHTLLNHVRPDGSSFHVVYYNATTGAVISKGTAQGYSNSSTWSRGHTWGMYGFTNMYSKTNQTRYLDTARAMATYFVNNVPSSGVVPWDFNAPTDPYRPSDSSAAMIAATTFLFLSQQEASLSPPNKTGEQFWVNAALKVLNDNIAVAWRPEWQSLLANGTVNNVQSPPNNLTGIVYGDYYFVHSGNALISMGLSTCNGSAGPSATANGSTTGSGSGSGGSGGSSGGGKSTGMRGVAVSGWVAALMAMVAVVGAMV